VLADAFGKLVFVVTVVVTVFVHPFPGSVTVNVYIPETFTVGLAVEEVNPPGPFHWYVTPPVVEFPFIVALLFMQVIVPVVDALALGTAVLVVTIVVAVLTQPLPGSVTDTV
jgi:hypothetical protein